MEEYAGIRVYATMMGIIHIFFVLLLLSDMFNIAQQFLRIMAEK